MPVAIVTGASRGIGRAIALRLADDGMDIAINDLEKQAPLLQKVKAEVEQKNLDPSSPAMFDHALMQVENASGLPPTLPTKVKSETWYEKQSLPLEISQWVHCSATKSPIARLLNPHATQVMVANAGIIIPKSMMDIDLEEFSLILNVNVKGTFICYREAARQMIAQGRGGRIIGAASLAAYRPSHGSTPYAASKWAVRGLTQSMAYDLAEHDINVNAYCPGPVDTPMWEQIDEALAKEQGLAKGEAFARSVETRCGLKRPSVPDDIAAIASFLAGPGSRNITGQAMIVDGGIAY
ncbi:hypothetical protein LTR84_001360 [Exophiala bonariae]|uniref:Diacetyl reductase [(S)-acetoin forming] n=1 Tax=Exophiala bonariae TaxID=1690606 RepID=A0AAV9NFU6_9EURO|nr:hypothetical protein LTR84_001360 [Exophiala bonariae]